MIYLIRYPVGYLGCSVGGVGILVCALDSFFLRQFVGLLFGWYVVRPFVCRSLVSLLVRYFGHSSVRPVCGL